MRLPLRRRYQVIRTRREPFTGKRAIVREAPPAPARRMFWTRLGAEVEAIRLNATCIPLLSRSLEAYEVVRRS
jgi:hypothetical protein